MRQKDTLRSPADPRRALFHQARKLDPEPEHCFQVRKNAERLYVALAEVHGLGRDEWPFLEASALLHDIGQRRGVKGHHKHSRDMILERNWPGLDDRTRLIVACTARYHRKSPPKVTHAHYRDLAQEDQRLVLVLAAILRIADGLDRAHRASVRGITAEIFPKSVSLRIQQRMESPDDLAGALRKADLFQQAFGKMLHITSDAVYPTIAV